MWICEIVQPKGSTKPHDLEGHTMNHFRHGLIFFGGQEQERGLINDCYLLRIGDLLSKEIPSSLDLFGLFSSFFRKHKKFLFLYFLIDALIQPIRSKFLKKAERIPVLCMDDMDEIEKLARGTTGFVLKAIVRF